jgi:hypothetical protein
MNPDVARNGLGSKLINMIAFANLQQFSEAIGNCDKSLCLHTSLTSSGSAPADGAMQY